MIPIEASRVYLVRFYMGSQRWHTRWAAASLLGVAVWFLCPQSLHATVHEQQQRAGALQTVQGVLATLKCKTKDLNDNTPLHEEKIRDIIEKNFIPHFDVGLFVRLVLGDHYQRFSTSQRKDASSAIRSSLIKAYGKSLFILEQTQRFEYMPFTEGSIRPYSKRASGKQAFRANVDVKVFLINQDAPTSLLFVLTDRSGKWRIFDVILNGTSFVRQLRNSYALTIGSFGLQGFINKLDGS